MHEELVIAGSGGQGILLIGTLTSLAAMEEGKETTWFPSYGPLMRTGEATCTVIISSEEIGSPISGHPDSLLIMSEKSLKFTGLIKPGGLLIINKSLADWNSSRTDIDVLEVRATDIAQELGNPQVANLIMLGVYLKKKGTVSLENIIKALERESAKKKLPKSLLELNKKALERGFKEINKPCT